MALQSSPSFDYDVFISFRGSDTRFSFTGYLYNALNARGIRTFIDDRELKGGDEITPSLFKAIEASKIAIVVFSKDYASSSFCLDELSHIMKFFTENNRLILPVFYGVEPTEIRHQTLSYGKAIANHEEKFQKNVEKYGNYFERLQKWKMALRQAADLSGYHLTIGSEMKQYEYKFIESIVDRVSIEINRTLLHVVDYCVGSETRVLEVKSLLNMGSDGGVCIVGIHGIGGIGKTTLAKQVYNSIANLFEALCFLENVREKEKNLGLVHLQETLLGETIREKDLRLGSACRGVSIIKQRLQTKKVLLILDDVNDIKQLKNLVGEPNWLGPGSRVIVTTRDKELLASHKIETTYKVEGLNREEALELLTCMAFKNNKVDSKFEPVLERVVTYASGLPLALEVMGSTLSGKEHIREWESLLSRYERIPHKDIQKILEVSFDSLQKEEQEVFLDIACCFKGYELSKVERILCAHYGECMKCHIQVLVEKSLIKIDYPLQVRLHDLVEAMGKEIVRRESPTEPGERSRLWFHEDIVSVLKNNTGTSQIKIIHLNFPISESKEGYEIEWDGDELKNMINLKTLIIKDGCFSDAPQHIPNNLRVFEWCRYPSEYLPTDFHPKLLSMCTLTESCLISFRFPDSLKKFRNMKELNLDYCHYLTHIDDLSGLTNLEKLSFQSCRNLTSIHDSVGLLNKLKLLNAWGCRKFKCFPPLKLTSLEKLNLSWCTSLKSFPEILGGMKNIKRIRLWNTGIEEFPASFQNLTGLESLDVEGGGMLRFTSTVFKMSSKLSNIHFKTCIWPSNTDELNSMVSSPKSVKLLECNVLNEFLPKILTLFANVTSLDLSGNNFTIVPECLKECRFLRKLDLSYCKFLQEIRGISPNLKELNARGCKPFTSSSIRMLLDQKLHEDGDTYFEFTGTDRIPEWFEHQSSGPLITFWFRNSLPSIALFVHSISMCGGDEILFRPFLSINRNKYSVMDFHRGTHYDDEMRYDHTYLYDVRLQEQQPFKHLNKALLEHEWIRADITFGYMDLVRDMDQVVNPKLLFLESGIHVFKQKSNMEDIQFTDPYKKRKLDEYLNDSSIPVSGTKQPYLSIDNVGLGPDMEALSRRMQMLKKNCGLLNEVPKVVKGRGPGCLHTPLPMGCDPCDANGLVVERTPTSLGWQDLHDELDLEEKGYEPLGLGTLDTSCGVSMDTILAAASCDTYGVGQKALQEDTSSSPSLGSRKSKGLNLSLRKEKSFRLGRR